MYIGTGINIKINDEFIRYTTVSSTEEAIKIAYVLGMKNEPNLWTAVEVEEIYLLDDGSHKYEHIIYL